MTSDRTLIARKAAHILHGTHDSKKLTANARAAALARFDAMVPAEITDPEERARRAAHLRKAFYVEIGRKGAAARRK
jgi:hypothetical protein